jgi:spermidine synthase
METALMPIDGVADQEAFDRVWLRDHNPAGDIHLYRRLETRYAARTAFQTVEVARVEPLGWCLMLDGLIQSAEVDERLYHELLVHPTMLLHPRPRRVLVLGGGEGATVREALRHPSVEEVVMVDLDGEVVEACRRYLPTWHAGAFDDPRTRLVIDDAAHYLREVARPGQFDVVIGDLTDPDPDGPAAELFAEPFFALVADRLAPGGMLGMQAGNAGYIHGDPPGGHLPAILRRRFAAVAAYAEYIPSFDLVWLYLLAGDFAADALDPDRLGKVAVERGLTLRHYGPAEHRHVFGWPFLSRWMDLTPEPRL